MHLVVVILTGVIVTVAIGALVALRAFRRAEDGYEDRTGFHHGRLPGSPAEMPGKKGRKRHEPDANGCFAFLAK